MADSLVSAHSYVAPEVVVGANVTVGPGAVVLGPCTIGDNVWIGPGAQIGAPPEINGLRQNASWAGDIDHFGVRILTGAIIREGAVIHQGSHRATTVGEDTWILNRAYIAHDVMVGTGCTISAGVSVGGHCDIGNNVTIGMNATVHQRRRIGAGSLIGMGTPVTYDLPPFIKAYGSPMRTQGANTIGMQRLGYSGIQIRALDSYYAGTDFLKPVDASAPVPDELRLEIRQWQNLPNLKLPRR